MEQFVKEVNREIAELARITGTRIRPLSHKEELEATQPHGMSVTEFTDMVIDMRRIKRED